MIGLFIKSFLGIVVMLTLVGMFFMPMELAIADGHHSKSNKCRIVCKHRNKHGVCLIRKEDCGGSKVEEKKLYAIKPDIDKDEKEKKDEKKEKNKSGKMTCHKDSPPRKSKTKGKHMDEDCCPDPDEWANPRCEYSLKDYSIMLGKPYNQD